MKPTERAETPLSQPIPKKEGAPSSTNNLTPPSEKTEGIECPNDDDVSESVDKCEQLCTDAQRILNDLRKKEPVHQAQPVETITVWRKGREQWNTRNDALIDGCGLLLSANGKMVFPEIPLALKNLRTGGEWLKRSMDAADLGQLRTSRLYVRRAREAIHRARSALGGKYTTATDRE
jgi:hypothetical protein